MYSGRKEHLSTGRNTVDSSYYLSTYSFPVCGQLFVHMHTHAPFLCLVPVEARGGRHLLKLKLLMIMSHHMGARY